MPRIISQHFGFISLFALLFGLAGCRKFVTINPPPTQLEAGIIFENDQTAVSSVAGLYSRMGLFTLSLPNGGATVYPALSADELYNTASSIDYDLYVNNSLIVNDAMGTIRLWKYTYQNIYHANAILEGLAASRLLSDSVRQRLQGETLVTRAFFFFYLVNHFGAVPYTISTDYRVNQSMARTPVSEIYEHIVADLKEAKNLLAASSNTIDKTRPNKWAASALLARIYLYNKDYINAEPEAANVLQSNTHSLVAFPGNVFAPGSAEVIWQLSKSTNNTAEGSTFIPATATTKPTFAVTTQLLNAFESTDKRKAAWLNKNTITGVDYYYPYKYKVRLTTPVTEFYAYLRLAELYLIRAEARTMQNNFSGAKADIDVIRSRAGLAGTTATTQATFMLAIEKERQTELFAEWGHRWLDLKRWSRADAVLGPLKSPNWQSTDTLYPVPLAETLLNPFLVQNPGY